MKIITNSQERDVVRAWELTETERSEFDYYDDEQIEWVDFVRYKGEVHDLGEFQTTTTLPEDSPLRAWHGLCSDSFFSGVVVRYVDTDCERVVVGTFIA